MQKFSKIGIIGVGFVGGAAKQYFSAIQESSSEGTQPIELFLYDKFKGMGSVAEVNRAEVVFIATPTPYDPEKGFDLSAVEDAIKILDGQKVVVIKSSVVPGTTEALQKKFPNHKILFNPEFLREISAYEDFIHPDKQIVGYTENSREVAEAVLELLPKAPYGKAMPAIEAEAVKYMANSFLAMKVVFANEFYDICKKLGIDYEVVSEAVVQDPRIGNSHFDVAHGGYRGYGGSCFPKDVNAIIELAKKSGHDTKFLKAMREINRELLSQSGVDEEYFLLNKHKANAGKKS